MFSLDHLCLNCPFEAKLTEDLGTLPRIVTYLLAFSLATRILCGGAIFCVVVVEHTSH